MAFAELLGRSAFSFLTGASLPEELVAHARLLELDALALCDRDGLYGSVRAHAAAKKLGQRVIVGASLSLSPVGEATPRLDDPLARAGETLRRKLQQQDVPALTLLVQNGRGYENLCRLLTLAHAGLPKGISRLEVDFLRQYHQGLTMVVPVPQREHVLEVQDWLARVSDCFRERGYVGIYRRLDGQDTWREQWAREQSLRWDLPIVASSYPLFHEPERKPLADILQCIKRGVTLERAGKSLESNAEARLRSEAEMLRLFSHEPEWVARSAEVAKTLSFSLEDLDYQFPCTLEAGETADERLARLVWEGARTRYEEGVPEKVVRQIEKELNLIAILNVAAYFLCTKEIVDIARQRRILCQGRGSAANSAVCFVLGITAVDPARSNLLFERFLSAERNEPPDIDIDFEHERREEVIQEIYRRYGREHAAMVAEVTCYRGKSALREVGKAFGLSLEQLDRLTSSITHWEGPKLSDSELRDYGFDARDERIQQVVRWAQELAGFPRHLSVHVGGFVLSKKPIAEVASVEPATMAGRTVLPWDKDDIEVLGFFKVDVLGLGMLTAIRKAMSLIYDDGVLRKSIAEPFDPLEVVTRVPAEDPAVYAMISEADTVGVFQIESRAQMAMLPRLRPQRFYDLVIEVAIVRPGPIQGGMVHPYLRRRNDEEPVVVPHPDLWPILERTLGVPLFQEQVMEIAIVGAGYSGGEADQLRRDMAAWKKTGRLMAHRQRLLDGFEKKGISPIFGEALFEQIKGFGDYGFPESHAASFALLVYLSAWQKAHFPAHFLCALLNSQPMGFYSPSSLVKDAQKHGVEVRPVDVATSQWDHTLEPVSDRSRVSSAYPEAQRALRLGFRLVKGLRQQAAESIVSARTKGVFTTIDELIRRTRLNRDEVQLLAEAGALESVVPGRRQALWAVKAPRTEGLFEETPVREPPVSLPHLPPETQLMLDYQRVGLSVDDHPLRHLRPKLRSRGYVAAVELQHVADQSYATVAGVVLSRQRPGTASGVVFITLEDETGSMNIVVFAKIFERYNLQARHASLLSVSGKVERQVTMPKKGEVGRPTPVIHVVAERLVRLDVPGRDLQIASRDFH